MRDKRVFVGDLTRKEFRGMIEDGTIKAAIVPTAATEQHLEHLEMIHDTASVTYMAEQAAKDFGFEPADSAVVGDYWSDIELGQTVGALTILVRTGFGRQMEEEGKANPDFIVDNLAGAVDVIKSSLTGGN